MNSELPKGWVQATIGDVAEGMKNGLYKPASSYANDGVACLRMYNIDAGKIVWKNIKRMKLTSEEVQEYQLLPGDLLVNRVNSRELVGKAAVVRPDTETCVFESKNIRLRLRRDLVCPEFVNYKLLMSGSQHFIHNAQQVVGMASISQPQLAAFELPLPPLAEQCRILAKLEKLLSRVDACQGRLARVPALLKRFRQAVLAAACAGHLTADWRVENQTCTPTDKISEGNSKALSNWTSAPLGELAKFIDYRGRTPRKIKSGIPLITAKNIRQGYIDPEPREYIREEDYDSWMTRGFPRRGDVLLTTEAPLGYAASVDTNEKFALAQRVICLQFHDSRNQTFALLFIQSPMFQRMLNEQATGTTVSGIKASRLKQLRIALPPKAEQQEIVRRVGKMFALADRIETRFAKGQSRVDSITKAILAKAFRGELVPTEFEVAKAEGRSFESAEELLERINGNGKADTKMAKGNSKLKH